MAARQEPLWRETGGCSTHGLAVDDALWQRFTRRTGSKHGWTTAGLRVLDLTRVLAGPWATQMLADFGADVIKIEKPGDGDDTRGWGPPSRPMPMAARGDAAYFLSANRGKRSVCIDMATRRRSGADARLAAKSDVVIENFKVGGLKKYGLDYDSLKAVNPRLIYCSITGFGQNGPYAQRAGYDFMIQGMAGIMSITGEPDGEPMKVALPSPIFSPASCRHRHPGRAVPP